MTNQFPVLTINGSDSAGSTGVQSDVRTVAALGGETLTVVTSVTTQKKDGLSCVYDLSPEVVAGQVRMAVSSAHPKVAKIGLIRDAQSIRLVSKEIVACRSLVCAPGILTTKGDRMMDDVALNAFCQYLLPLTTFVQLRCDEAQLLLRMNIDSDDDMILAAKKIISMGAQWVMLRGGRQKDGMLTALLYGEGTVRFFTSLNTEGWQRHGVGGALSAAVAVRLAYGDDVPTAVKKAHEYIHSRVVYAVTPEVSHRYRPADLYNQFMSLLAENYCKSHDVAFYADQLSISSRYLSMIAMKSVGKSPKKVIADYIMSEAKVLLDTSRLTIQEISVKLGFPSQSAFSNFFKNEQGSNPSEYRLK